MDRLTSPNYSDPNEPIEYTLALIKPDGMSQCDEIVTKILNAGFKIIQSKTLTITPEQAEQFYAHRCGEQHFPLLILCLSRGPARVMCLAKPKAIAEFNALIGLPTASQSIQNWPGSLRSYYACDVPNLEFNAIHGSANNDMARQEIRFFFPNSMCNELNFRPKGVYRMFFVFSYCSPDNESGRTETVP